MNSFIARKTEAGQVDRAWAVGLLWTLRAVLVFTAVAELAIGRTLYAAEAVLALALCTVPGALLKVDGGPSALDIEILLLLIAVGNCTLGVAGNLYRSLPYYDKFLHVVNPMALAYYCLLLLHRLVDGGRTDVSPVALIVLTVLLILGVSAIWEMLEYASDQLADSTAQGSPLMAPLDDTMWDLFLNGIGGLVGAALASWSLPRLHEFGRHVSIQSNSK